MPGTASKIRAPEVRPEDAVRGVAKGGEVVRCWRGMIGRCHNPKHSRAEWARIVGIAPGVIERRYRYGWSLERALTTPVNFKRRPRSAA